MFSFSKALEQRRLNNSRRGLMVLNNLIDFSSNDYLGISRNNSLKAEIDKSYKSSDYPIGSTGSRLLSGNSALTEELEQGLAIFFNSEAGLLFNSGYDANIGLLSCIAGRNDTILLDEFAHASAYDGKRLSLAKSLKFKHNDPEDLDKKLSKSSGTAFVYIESVYSMDGTEAAIEDTIEVCKRHGALLIVDEAHSTGIYGKTGNGFVCEKGLEKEVFARIHTFGKAIGCHGAFICGSKDLRDFLINFSRPFIYSTALPLHSILTIKHCIEFTMRAHNERKSLIENGKLWNKLELNYGKKITNNTQIKYWVKPGNIQVKELATALQQKGFDVRPILSPTVPEGSERIRISLHSFNTENEILSLFTSIINSEPSK